MAGWYSSCDEMCRFEKQMEAERDKMVNLCYQRMENKRKRADPGRTKHPSLESELGSSLSNKTTPFEVKLLIDVYERTVKAGKNISDFAAKVCEAEKCEHAKDSPCFFTDMRKYKTEVPGRVLKTLIFLMRDRTEAEYMMAAEDALGYLDIDKKDPNTNIRGLAAEEYQERLEYLPNNYLINAMLKELGFYLSWIQAVVQNPRKFVKIAARMLPPCFNKIELFLNASVHTQLIGRREYLRPLLDCYHLTYYQKAFLGKYGLYGIFYIYTHILLRSLSPYMCDTKMLHWMFDLDVRRVFIKMARSVYNITEEDEIILDRSMPLAWCYNDIIHFKSDKPSPLNKVCRCGKPVVRSFWVVTGKFPLPLDLSPPVDKRHVFDNVGYCDRLCFLEDFAKMLPEIQIALNAYIASAETRDEHNQHKFEKAWKKLSILTVKVDLDLLMKNGVLARTQKSFAKLPSPREVKSLGFEWEAWGLKPPNDVSRYGNIRFCWSCLKYGVKLYLCSSCRKARYCNRLCSAKHWEEHKHFCFYTRYLEIMKKRGENVTDVNSKSKRQGNRRGSGPAEGCAQSDLEDFLNFKTDFQNIELD